MLSSSFSVFHESPPPSSQNKKPRQQHEPTQHRPNQQVRIKRREEEEEQTEEEGPTLESVIASASHSELSHILLDLCRHSKTAADLTRSHLVQTATPVAAQIEIPVPVEDPAEVAVAVPVSAVPAIPAIPAIPVSRKSNQEFQKPKVLRSILKRRKGDIVFYASYSSSGESTRSPTQPDDASPSLGRVSATRSPSVAFSLVPTTAETSNSSSSKSNSKSSGKSKSNGSTSSSSSSSSSKPSKSSKSSKASDSQTSPAPESDSPNSKKRKGPTSAPTRCRNCGSQYANATPNSSPNGNKSTTSKGGKGEEEEVCVHHSGEREVQPSHEVWENFDPYLHGDAWTLMEYEAFACGFRWSCCKREVGEKGCVVAKRHEAAPMPLDMPMWKRARR